MVHVGAATHVGKVRANNEDGYLVQGGLLAVADGMGGHNAGEVASGTVLAVLRDYPFAVGEAVPSAPGSHGGIDLDQQSEHPASHPEDDATTPALSDAARSYFEAATELSFVDKDISRSDPAAQLNAAVRLAHGRLVDMANENPALSGMGTTLTAALLTRDTIHIAHVGDSRLYMWRDGQLLLLTRDHSLVAELLRAGEIDEEAARRHPLRHAVTRAVGAGSYDELEIDVMSVARRPGDGLLLCTDGLSALVSDTDIAQVLEDNEDVQKAADTLVDLALARGGVDNVTVVLARPAGRGVSR